MNNRYKRLKCSRGVAMVEFAIVLPLLIILVFGITELGRALYEQNTLVKSVIAGARYVARYPGLEFSSDCETVTAGDWGTAHDKAINLIVYGNVNGGAQPLIPNLSAATVDITSTEGGVSGVCVIRVVANVPFAGVFSDRVIPFSDVGPFSINAETEERYIGQ